MRHDLIKKTKSIMRYHGNPVDSIIGQCFNFLESLYYAAKGKHFDCVVAGSNIFLDILAIWYSSFIHTKTLLWAADKTIKDDWNYNLFNIKYFRHFIEQKLNFKSENDSNENEKWIKNVLNYIIMDCERNYMEKGWRLFVLNHKNRCFVRNSQTRDFITLVIKNKEFDEIKFFRDNVMNNIFLRLLENDFVVKMNKIDENNFLFCDRLIVTSQIENFLSFSLDEDGHVNIREDEHDLDVLRGKALFLGTSNHIYKELKDAIFYPMADVENLCSYFHDLKSETNSNANL